MSFFPWIYYKDVYVLLEKHWSRKTDTKMCELLRETCEHTSVIRIRGVYNQHKAWEKGTYSVLQVEAITVMLQGPLMMVADSIMRKYNNGILGGPEKVA